ncbi:4-hydroxybenzoate octaprenyltransferase [Planctomycetales bacterium]|nr:4-hydroxybenzoate octaprenyltransferase [Planctomycetales bacterium]
MFVRYLELIRFSHTLFALPFAVLSAVMAWRLNVIENGTYIPRIADVAGILLCMVFARSAAMGFNRWADRKIDAANPRTANRHIPAGILTSKNVLVFTAVCSLGFIFSTLLFLPNIIPVCFSLPVLLFLFGYSFAKRWTVSAHFWLGTALMLAPLASWIVIRPILFPVPLPPLALGLAVLFWTAGFDLIYACQDTETDAKQNLYSIPGRFGIPAAFRISALSHIISVFFLLPLFWYIRRSLGFSASASYQLR